MYAAGNPIRYNDPSGYCSGNPNNPKNPDKTCWDLYRAILSQFTNVRISGRHFNSQELSVIYAVLLAVKEAFDNDNISFQQALGNFAIIKVSPINGGMTPPGLKTIALGDNVFDDPNQAFEIIAHEIGHIFDFNTAGANPELYKSRTFIEIFNSGECNIGALGCLGADPPEIYKSIDMLSSGGGVGQYNPQGNPSAYGRKSSVDDFADSFARHVLDSPGVGVTIPFDQIRDTIISVWVDLSKGIK